MFSHQHVVVFVVRADSAIYCVGVAVGREQMVFWSVTVTVTTISYDRDDNFTLCHQKLIILALITRYLTISLWYASTRHQVRGIAK